MGAVRGGAGRAACLRSAAAALEHHARGRRPQYVSHEFLFASVNDDHSTSLLMRRVFIERWRDRAGSGLSRGR
jgi:hypothetical protein